MKKATLPASTLALLMVVSGRVCSQPGPDAGTPLKSQIDAVLDATALASGFQGVDIETVKTGQVLYRRNAERVFLPASNNKLLTASAALALLGPEFRYRTEVRALGEVKDGVLNGSLVISGSGDPVLISADLQALAAQVHAAGIHRITGGVKYDATVFDEQWLGDSWTWDDEPYAYSAQIGGLNVDHNTILVSVSPGKKEGDLVSVLLPPGAASCVTLEVTAETRTGSRGSSISVERSRGQNSITVTGEMAPGARPLRAPITIENPPLFTAKLFRYFLEEAGIACAEPVPSKSVDKSARGEVVATHSSPPLSEILVQMLKPSDNTIAECLLKTVGAAKSRVGTAGPAGTGATAARAWLLSIGLEKTQFRQADGSGLSRQDYVSPANLVRLLRYWVSRRDYQTFLTALPIAGVDGTLRNRMKGTLAENNCRAKTGSLSQDSCLSGYVTSKDGIPLVFSIMMNNQLGSMTVCTAAENQIVELLASSNVEETASGHGSAK